MPTRIQFAHHRNRRIRVGLEHRGHRRIRQLQRDTFEKRPSCHVQILVFAQHRRTLGHRTAYGVVGRVFKIQHWYIDHNLPYSL